MELFYALAGAILLGYFIMKNENKDVSNHNTKVAIENTLKDAYKTSDITTVSADIKKIEPRYLDLVETGISRFRTRFPNSSQNQGIFLGFDRVFSVDEFLLISKYESMYTALNARNTTKKLSAYQQAVKMLEYEYNIESVDDY